MATGKKPTTGCGAHVKRIEKLSAELKVARKNLRDAVKKAVRESKSWQGKLAAQVKRYEGKLKNAQHAAMKKYAAVYAKKEAAKKADLHKALVAAETKFEKAFVKKAKKKPKRKAAPKKKVVHKKKAAPKKKVVKKAKPKKAAPKKVRPKKK
jgi:hypothetical protein